MPLIYGQDALKIQSALASFHSLVPQFVRQKEQERRKTTARLPERLTQASCLQSWLEAMNVGTEILQVAEEHTNYRQQDMCVLIPGQ